METPQFNENGRDDHTFAPFVLENALDTEWKDVRLEFSNWDWFVSTYGADVKDGYYLDDYYLNGPGVEGLVKATLFSDGLDPEMDGIDYNSEADTCYIHFENLDTAVQAAQLCAQMIADPQKLQEAIQVAREQGFDDG